MVNANLVCQTVRVWVATLSQADLTLRRWLDDLELERLCRYESQADAARFLLGAVMLRLAVGNELEISPRDLPVQRACETCGRWHGRPVVPDSGLELSVSHSGLVVAFALAIAGPVGIDVERVGDHRPEVIRSWTHAEARLKAGGGSGLAMHELAAPLSGYIMSLATAGRATVTVQPAAELFAASPPRSPLLSSRPFTPAD